MPQAGERISDTDYIYCDNACRREPRSRPGDADKVDWFCNAFADKEHACTPNSPKDHPERCHCRPFKRKDGAPPGPWEPVPVDDDGNFRMPDYRTHTYECFCCRHKPKS